MLRRRLTLPSLAKGDVSYGFFSSVPGSTIHARGTAPAPSRDSGRDLPGSQLRLFDSFASCVGVKGRKPFVGDVGLLPARLPVLLAGRLFDLLPGEPVRCGICLIKSKGGCREPGSTGVVDGKVGVRPGEADSCAGDCPFPRSGKPGAESDECMSVASCGSFAESRVGLSGCKDSDVLELAPLLVEELLPMEKMDEMRLEDFFVVAAIVQVTQLFRPSIATYFKVEIRSNPSAVEWVGRGKDADFRESGPRNGY